MNSPFCKTEIESELGSGVFVRLAAQDNALMISDAPRRLSAGQLTVAQDALAGLGYASWINERGLLALDWDERQWHVKVTAFQHIPAVAVPTNGRLENVHALARLLAAHPSPLTLQPKPMLRALLKRYHLLDAMLQFAPGALSVCAQQLRAHQPLSAAGAGILYAWLRDLQEVKTV